MKKISVFLFLIWLVACNPGTELTHEASLDASTLTTTNLETTSTAESSFFLPTQDMLTATPSINIQVDSVSIPLAFDYFDGMIVLTQYYTLLGHHLYEDAYNLLSAGQQQRYSLEEFSDFYVDELSGLEIRSILPYDYWLALQEVPTSNGPANELRFFVLLTFIRNEEILYDQSTPVPDPVTGFQSIILENGAWKIDEFNTSPWADQP